MQAPFCGIELAVRAAVDPLPEGVRIERLVQFVDGAHEFDALDADVHRCGLPFDESHDTPTAACRA
jgi:hypothetical protein